VVVRLAGNRQLLTAFGLTGFEDLTSSVALGTCYVFVHV